MSLALLLGCAAGAFGQIGPNGWWSQAIGTAAQGSVVAGGDAFEVTGEGDDIWNNADAFQFMYKELSGDGSMTARVVSKGAGANTWAKGGVMIRNRVAAGSEHAMMVVTANSDGAAGNGAAFQYRGTTDGTSTSVDSPTVIAPPYWVRMGGSATPSPGLSRPTATPGRRSARPPSRWRPPSRSACASPRTRPESSEPTSSTTSPRAAASAATGRAQSSVRPGTTVRSRCT